MKYSHLVLALSLTFGTTAALAQNAPTPLAAPAVHPTPVAAQASGTVARFIVGPGGRVRSLMLNNGTLVMVNPRANPDIAQRVRVGQAVRVEGFSRPGGGDNVIFRATIRGADGSVIAQAPANAPFMGGGAGWRHGGNHGERDLGPRGWHGGGHHGMRGEGMRHRLANLPTQTTNGTVQRVINGMRGTPRTLLLANNTTVYVPRGMGAQLARRGVRVGETIRASGRGSVSPQGTGLVAEQLTFADGATFNAPVSTAPNGTTPPNTAR
jgi:hypothetical protein